MNIFASKANHRPSFKRILLISFFFSKRCGAWILRAPRGLEKKWINWIPHLLVWRSDTRRHMTSPLWGDVLGDAEVLWWGPGVLSQRGSWSQRWSGDPWPADLPGAEGGVRKRCGFRHGMTSSTYGRWQINSERKSSLYTEQILVESVWMSSERIASHAKYKQTKKKKP